MKRMMYYIEDTSKYTSCCTFIISDYQLSLKCRHSILIPIYSVLYHLKVISHFLIIRSFLNDLTSQELLHLSLFQIPLHFNG